MGDHQSAKALVRAANVALDAAGVGAAGATLSEMVAPGYHWRGMHPFHTQEGAHAVARAFWDPLKAAFGAYQRRPDIFFAGFNELDGFRSTWVVEMGHLMGLWDGPWLGLAPSGKLAFLRYCEFHRIEAGKIAETAHFIDILSLLAQVGRSPIPETTGLSVLSPGPRTHDGLLYTSHPEPEGRATLSLISEMIADLRRNGVESPADHMSRFWTPDMAWIGPGGIGASAFYEGYRRGHTDPFEAGLEYVDHSEHVARLGEGQYGGFFGYPSLTMRSKGYLGLPASETPADMRIVDLYRREGDRLAENWIFIDLPHFYAMQGVDLLSL